LAKPDESCRVGPRTTRQTTVSELSVPKTANLLSLNHVNIPDRVKNNKKHSRRLSDELQATQAQIEANSTQTKAAISG
jgi:hypothetical protein